MDSNFMAENILLWTNIHNSLFEAGVYHYGDVSRIYAELKVVEDIFKISVGNLGETYDNGFILSHGEYFPGTLSTPDKRPLGYSLQLDFPWLEFFTGFYTQMGSENLWYVEDSRQIQLHSAAGKISVDEFNLSAGVNLSSEKPYDYMDRFEPLDVWRAYQVSFFTHLNFQDKINFHFDYSFYYGWLGMLNISVQDVSFNVYVMHLVNENIFRAMLYDQKRTYLLSIYHPNFNFKIYDSDSVLHAKFKWHINGFGFYNYVNDRKMLTGVYYHSMDKALSPYVSFYLSPDAQVIMGSLGINFNEKWLFALVFCTNNTDQYFPYDEQLIPSRFYSGGTSLDSETIYNDSYIGFQFYWNEGPFFAYTSFVQNYAVNMMESLAVIIRLEYALSF